MPGAAPRHRASRHRPDEGRPARWLRGGVLHVRADRAGRHLALGFTYDNATGRCLLFRAPLRPHTAGAENNTSGSWISLGPLPPPPPPPGPPAPAVPFPAAQPTIPTTPTFAKPPRPNIVLFFGDGAPPCCVSSLPPLPLLSWSCALRRYRLWRLGLLRQSDIQHAGHRHDGCRGRQGRSNPIIHL